MKFSTRALENDCRKIWTNFKRCKEQQFFNKSLYLGGGYMNEAKNNENEFFGTFNGFEGFIDKISDFLKAPVTLEDAHHHLLCYSNHENVKDSVRISTIIGRQVPEKVINGLWKEGIIPALMASDKPIRIKKKKTLI